MALTTKQEAFAQAVVSGMNQSDAYRSAYKVKPETKPESVNVNASKMMADANVAQRVHELRAELANKALWTREQSVAVLVNVINEGGSRAGDKINAVKVLNDMQGFNAPEEHVIKATVVQRIELVALK